MYQSYYNLNAKPFQITTDPKFLWLGEKHKEALATLKYGILDNKGFLLLTGDVGTGKTALINALNKIIDVAAIVATIPDPGLDTLDFFNILAEEFKMNRKFDSKGTFLIHLKHFLHDAYADEKKVLLIVDESQRLDHDLLEQIRLLSNIEMNNRKLINIFFVGQSEFNDMLLEDRNKAIRQRIAVSYHIEPLTENEMWHYIRHRLKVAGTEQEIFQQKAIHEIYAFSQGYPRLINIICDHALLTGYATGAKTIDENIINECKKELKIPIDTKKFEGSLANVSNNVEIAGPMAENEEQPIGKRAFLVILLIILVIFAGYFFYNSQLEKAPRFAMDDIAPSKYDSPALREKETFVPGMNQEKQQAQGQTAEATTIKKPEEIAKTDKTPVAQDISEETVTVESGAEGSLPDRKMLIYFKHNSNELPDEAFKALDRIAEFLIHHPKNKVSVKGYTDSSGAYSYNVSVSKFRANTIKSYLVGKGVNPTSIEALGMGPEDPIATNKTEEGRRLNRRVEIELGVESQ